MPDFVIHKGDTLPVLQVQLVPAEGQSLDLTGATVRFKMYRNRQSPDPIVDAAAEIVSISNRIVRYVWTAGDTDLVDGFFGIFVVTLSGGGVETFPNFQALTIRVEP